MADEKVNFVLAAKDNASRTVRQLKGELGTLGGTAGKAAGPLGKLSAVTGGFITPATVAIAGTVALGAAFLGAAKAAMDEERGIALLTSAIRANDPANVSNIAGIEATITERQKLAFADDEQRESLGSLIAVTKDSSKALDLQRTAMDLARLRGMSLADASMLIGKVYGGNLGILSRYGIQLAKGTTATEALAEIQRRAAGQAEAFAKTTGGAMESARLAFDDVVEEIGAALLPALTSIATWARDSLIPAIREVVSEVGKFGSEVGTAVDHIGDMLQRFDIQFGDMGAGIERTAQKAGLDVADFKNLVITAMNEMNMSIGEAEEYAKQRLGGIPLAATDAGRRMLADWKQMDLGGQAVTVFEPVGDAIEGEVNEGADAAVERVRKTPGQMATALEEGREAWRVSWEHMMNAGVSEIDKGKRISLNLAHLASTELTEALASDDPARVAWAQQTRRDLIAALNIDGYNYGRNLVQTFQRGMRDHAQGLVDESGFIAAKIRGTWAVESEPKDPKSPLRGVTKWGGNFIRTITDGMRSEMGSLGAVAAMLPSLAPTITGAGARGGNVALAGPSGVGGVTMNITVNPPPTWNPADGQRLARAILPELTRELRRQGVVN